MRVTATIGHKKVTVSKHAADVLSALCELEDAGLIEAGRTIQVDPGYDAGSLEGDTPPVVTHLGRVFVYQSI